jgi:hypothetical protein
LAFPSAAPGASALELTSSALLKSSETAMVSKSRSAFASVLNVGASGTTVLQPSALRRLTFFPRLNDASASPAGFSVL